MTPRRHHAGRFVDVPGFGRVHVRFDGPDDAPALVCLHGFSGSLHWYDLAVPYLIDTFRLVRVDLLGHGSTGGAAADAPRQAAMVDALLGEFGVSDVVAVGHSFGADVAVELAERSERVRALIVLTQAPDYSDANLPRGNVIMTLPVIRTVLHRSAPVLATVLGRVLAALHRSPMGSGELAARALADLRALDVAMFRIVLVDRRDRMAARPLDAQVAAAGKPTLVVLGEQDHFYGARSADRYRAAGASVVVLDGCGHSPLVERPERTAELIGDFATRSAAV